MGRGAVGLDRGGCPASAGEWRLIPEWDDLTRAHFEWVRLPPAKWAFRGILPRRRGAERTLSWFGQSRRLAKDYERLCTTSEVMIYATMSHLMLRRLARADTAQTVSSGPRCS